MQIVDVEQRSKAWFDLRKKHITATDACVIMGDGFKTKEVLYEEKVGQRNFEPAINAAMERGIELEPVALALFNLQTGLDARPQVAVKGFQLASMDGLTPDLKTAVEIKCPGAKTHMIAQSGAIPSYYYAQLQHQMSVCDLYSMFYFSFFDDEGITIEIARDDEYIADMIEQEAEFYECVRNRTPPVIYLDRNDWEFEGAAIAYVQARKQLKAAQEREEALKRDLFLMAGGQNVKGAGIKIKQVERRGNIDYSKIPELQNVDLERYRSKSVQYCKIS